MSQGGGWEVGVWDTTLWLTGRADAKGYSWPGKGNACAAGSRPELMSVKVFTKSTR